MVAEGNAAVLLATDALIKNPNDTRAADAFERARKALASAELKRTKLSRDLALETKKIEAEKNKFADYIAKKEKSRNPFRGKKSLDTARQLIIGANRLIRDNSELFLFTSSKEPGSVVYPAGL